MQLSEDQRSLLMDRYKLLQDMHPEEQARFYENYDMWKRLSDQGKQELITKWSSLSTEQRKAFLSKWTKVDAKEQREAIKKMIKKIRRRKLDANTPGQPQQ